MLCFLSSKAKFTQAEIPTARQHIALHLLAGEVGLNKSEFISGTLSDASSTSEVGSFDLEEKVVRHLPASPTKQAVSTDVGVRVPRLGATSLSTNVESSSKVGSCLGQLLETVNTSSASSKRNSRSVGIRGLYPSNISFHAQCNGMWSNRFLQNQLQGSSAKTPQPGTRFDVTPGSIITYDVRRRVLNSGVPLTTQTIYSF
jgi:hypothetical protein